MSPTRIANPMISFISFLLIFTLLVPSFSFLLSLHFMADYYNHSLVYSLTLLTVLWNSWPQTASIPLTLPGSLAVFSLYVHSHTLYTSTTDLFSPQTPNIVFPKLPSVYETFYFNKKLYHSDKTLHSHSHTNPPTTTCTHIFCSLPCCKWHIQRKTGLVSCFLCTSFTNSPTERNRSSLSPSLLHYKILLFAPQHTNSVIYSLKKTKKEK